MAIENLGFVLASSYADALAQTGGSSIKIHPSTPSTDNVYLRFRTMSGKSANVSVNVALEWVGVPKATAAVPDTEYEQRGKWTVQHTLAVPDDGTTGENGLRVELVDGFYEWAVPFEKVSQTTNINGGDWTFDKRKYDEVRIGASVSTNYNAEVVGSEGPSPTAKSTTWIGYIPEYWVESASFDLIDFKIVLGRTDSWKRSNDRWAVEGLSIVGGSIVAVDHPVYGQVDNGVVTIPMEHLTEIPDGTLDYDIRINAAYKASGMQLTRATGSVDIANQSTCNTPVPVATVDGDTVTVKVTDSKDVNPDRPIKYVLVKLHGSDIPYDSVVAELGQDAVFHGMPAGHLRFDVIATDDDDATTVSAVATAEVDVENHGAMIHDVELGFTHRVEWNVDISWNGESEKTSVKLADRDRESTYYGVGGSASGTINFYIIGEDAMEQADELAFARECIFRWPDGHRSLIAVENVNAKPDHNGVRLTVNFREVV